MPTKGGENRRICGEWLQQPWSPLVPSGQDLTFLVSHSVDLKPILAANELVLECPELTFALIACIRRRCGRHIGSLVLRRSIKTCGRAPYDEKGSITSSIFLNHRTRIAEARGACCRLERSPNRPYSA